MLNADCFFKIKKKHIYKSKHTRDPQLTGPPMSRKLPQSVLCIEIKLEHSLALLLHLARCNLIRGSNKDKRM